MTATANKPFRMCIACRNRAEKAHLLRLVRTADGKIDIDPEQRKPGRGAYLCFSRSCVNKAMKQGQPSRHLHADPSPDFLQTLLSVLR